MQAIYDKNNDKINIFFSLDVLVKKKVRPALVTLVMWSIYGNVYSLIQVPTSMICSIYRERLVTEYDKTGELLVELGSDQTSLHNPFNGGYYPVQLTFEEAKEMMKSDPARFKELVQERYVLYRYLYSNSLLSLSLSWLV